MIHFCEYVKLTLIEIVENPEYRNIQFCFSCGKAVRYSLKYTMIIGKMYDPNSIRRHFCSKECKNEYIKKWKKEDMRYVRENRLKPLGHEIMKKRLCSKGE